MSFKKKSINIMLTAALVATPVAVFAYQKDVVYHFTILHTNDEHGHFLSNSHGEYGLAAQATIVKQIRDEVTKQGGDVLVLSAGDLNTGTPESNTLLAEPDIVGMNMIGYDAMALGNHEFDHPINIIKQQEKIAKFPFISANIYLKDQHKNLVKPYVILNKPHLKFAVVGLTTPDTVFAANPNNVKTVTFTNPVTESKKQVADIKKHDNPDVTLALTHLGYYDNGNYGSNAPGDVTLLNQLPKGTFDVIIGGHSHTILCMNSKHQRIQEADFVPGQTCQPDNVNGTWVMQAGSWGRYIGRADFSFKNGVVTLDHYQLIPINLKKNKTDYYTQAIPQDKEVQKVFEQYSQKSNTKLNQVIGKTTGLFQGERTIVRAQQTNLGKLILTAYINGTHADFGLMSGGGIRDSLKVGNVTYKDILNVLPFNDPVVYVAMKGKDIPAYLAVLAAKTPQSGAYTQYRNISFTYQQGEVNNIKINGIPLDPNHTYRMVTVEFNAIGGDGYPKVDQLPGYINTRFSDAAMLKDYIHAHTPLSPQSYDHFVDGIVNS